MVSSKSCLLLLYHTRLAEVVASIAGMILSTNSLIVEKKEKSKGGNGGGHDHDDDY